jgi:hypothetical protein
MQYSKLFGWALAGVMAVGVAALPAKAQDGYWYGDGGRHDSAERHYQEKDLRHDYRNVNRLREDMADDQRKLSRDYWSGRSWKAERDARDLAHDRRELREQLRDIHRDKREMFRDGRQYGYDRY